MLTIENTVLVVIDVQGKLARIVYKSEEMVANLQKLIKGAKILGVPILLTEQYPEGLGPTIPEIKELLSGVQPISKTSFNCCNNEHFMQALNTLNRKQVLVTGIEAHVCVYQTAINLLNFGYKVEIVADAVSSRNPEHKQIGLAKVRDAGGSVTCMETALFELLKVAEGSKFKEIIKIVK